MCSDAQKRAYRGDKHCGLLGKKRGPFATCHDVIDPAPYLDDCLFDACLYEGHQDTVCQAIGAYVAACQSQGAAVRPWRTAAFCSMGRLGGLGRVGGGFGGQRGTQGLGKEFWAVRGGFWGVWQAEGGVEAVYGGFGMSMAGLRCS